MSDDGAVRCALAAQLAKQCARHHLVVWDDAARHYEDVAESVIPDGWKFERYSGSWWELRRCIEASFSAPIPPRLVVYLPCAPLPADPLEEVRQAAGSYKRLLPSLLNDALAGMAGAARIAELAKKCSTLTAVENALVGTADLDPVLIAATHAHDPESALAAFVVGEPGEHGPVVVAALNDLAAAHLGAGAVPAADDVDGVRTRLVQHLVLGELARTIGDDGVRELNADWVSLTAAQQRHLGDLVELLSRPATLEAWGALADEAATALRLQDLAWDARLVDCDVARCIDELAFAEAARRAVDDAAGARAITARRMDGSRWLRWRDAWSGRLLADLEAVRSVARLRIAIDAYPAPAVATFHEFLGWYADGAWEVDRAHRLMEASRYGLARPGLDEGFTIARDAYVSWLDALLSATNRAAGADCTTSLPRQADTYARHVAGGGRVALVIADAMRLELGHRLSELVQSVAPSRHVEAAVAAVPTITRVGMANLLPHSATNGIGVRIDGEDLTVTVDNVVIRTVADRTAAYRAEAGRVEDHTLSEWSSLGDNVLRDRLSKADLAIVRAQEVDAAGESGLAAVRWSQMDAAVDALAILITRLAGAGIERVVVTADHGFVALGRPLDPSRTRVTPTGRGIVEHGRAWIGRPASVAEGCTVLALAEFGIDSAESIVLPDGLTVLGAAGSGFLHGGVSPQELLVPVVVLEFPEPSHSTSEHVRVTVSVPGARISAEAFSVRVDMPESLFSADVDVRITAAAADGTQVARLMPGDAVDGWTGTVRLDPSTETILTFLVTDNLDRGSEVEVSVLDARTGRLLASTRAQIARNLRPQEDW